MNTPSFINPFNLTRIVSVFVLIGGASLSITPASRADDASSESPTVINKSTGSDLMFSVVNALTNHIKDTRLVDYQIEWEYLPKGAELKQMVGRDGLSRKVSFNIDNKALGDGTWMVADKSKPAVLKTLGAALGATTDEQLGMLTDATKIQEFSDAYVQGLHDAAVGTPGASPTLSSDEYITLLLDHYYLKFLLQSHGINYALTVTDATTRGGNEREFDDQIKWQFELFPLVKGPKTFYRVALKSYLSKVQRLEFVGASQETASLQIVTSFNNSLNTLGVATQILNQTSTVPTVSAPQSAELPNVAEKLGGSKISGILDFVGGVKLADVVSHQLFGGTGKSSLFYGGLVGQGSIKQLIGANQVLKSNQTGSTSVGILYGVAPERNNALFVGPTIQTGPITVGVGAVAREENKTGSTGTRVKVGSGGTIALDMSQLVGGKKNVQTISLKNSVIGGRSSDTVAKENFLQPLKVLLGTTITEADKEALKNTFFIFKRVKTFNKENGNEEDVTADQRITPLPVPNDVSTPYSRDVLLPRGMYEIRTDSPATFPSGFKVKVMFSLSGVTVEQDAVGRAFPVGKGGQTNQPPLQLVITK